MLYNNLIYSVLKIYQINLTNVVVHRERVNYSCNIHKDVYNMEYKYATNYRCITNVI